MVFAGMGGEAQTVSMSFACKERGHRSLITRQGDIEDFRSS